MFEGGLQSNVLRWCGVVAGYSVLWALVEAVGRYVVPSLQGLDQTISDAMNPDQYWPLVDEFFRALTDHTTFVIATPMVSLALGVAVYRMLSASAAEARSFYLRCVAFWWVLIGTIYLLEDLKAPVLLGLALFVPLLLLILVGLPRIIPPLRRVAPRKYVLSVLWLETAIFLVLWAWGKLFWNEGLPGANYVLLPVLILCFGGATVAFARMDDDAMHRFTGIFVIVMLASISCGAIATRAIKESIARPRPLADANQPWNAVMRAIPEETLRGASSYPSGHVSGTVSMLTPLFWWVRSRRAKVGLATWGALQGVSRIYTAAHFFSDCVMGAFFGFGVGTLLFFLLGGPALRAPAAAK